MDKNGTCLLDDIIAPKETCILWHGQEFYDGLVELQKEIEHNRTIALQNADDSVAAAAEATTQEPGVEELELEQGGEEEGEAEGEELSDAIKAEGRSIEAQDPARRHSRFSETALGGRSEEGSNSASAGSSELSEEEVARRDGPSFNADTLNGYFQSLGRLRRRDSADSLRRTQKSDGPQFHAGSLGDFGQSWEEAEPGPTLGYFQSLGRFRRD